MPKLNFVTPSLAFICLALGFFLWGTCQKNKVLELKAESVKAQHREQIQELDRQGQTKAARIVQLESERTRMRDSSKVSQNAAKREIEAYNKTIARLRPAIIDKIDSFPDMRAFVTAQDAVIAHQDSLITSLELAHSAEIVNLEAQLKVKGDQLMIEHTKSNLWEEVAVKNEKDYNKERRKKGFWKVTSAVLAGGIVFLSLKE